MKWLLLIEKPFFLCLKYALLLAKSPAAGKYAVSKTATFYPLSI